MELLTAKQTKVRESVKTKDREERIKKLNKEETESVRRLNDALTNETSEKKRIEETLELARDEGKATVKRSVLLQEIETLEARKAKALEPISSIKKEAEKTLEDAKKSFADSKIRSNNLNEREQDLMERIENVVDSEANATERHNSLNERSEKILAGEEELKKSTENLGKKWVEYHKEVLDKNAEMDRREKEVEDDKAANLAFKKTLNEKQRNIINDRIALEDGYRELAKSREEILGRKD